MKITTGVVIDMVHAEFVCTPKHLRRLQKFLVETTSEELNDYNPDSRRWALPLKLVRCAILYQLNAASLF